MHHCVFNLKIMYTNTIILISNIHIISNYHGIQRMLMTPRARTNRQRNRIYKHFSPLLESVKNGTYQKTQLIFLEFKILL